MNFWQKPVETLHELLRRKSPHLRQVRHFPSRFLGREVDFDLYLPPEYHLSPGKQFPFLLFNDGQDLQTMNFAHILEHGYYNGDFAPCIAVGVYANENRMREYGTARQPDYKGRGDKAPQFTRFVLEELLPMIEKRYRVSHEAGHRAYAGFSLGGLSAFDIAWSHPGLFGNVGVFSGALWWRWSDVDPADPDADRIIHDIVCQAPEWPAGQRYWFQCGTLDETDDRNNNGVIDAIDDTLDLIRNLKHKGCPDLDIRYLEMEGGEHNVPTWAQAMPDFLNWFLGSRR